MLPRKNNNKKLTEKEINYFKLLDFKAKGKVLNSRRGQPNSKETISYLEAIIDRDLKFKRLLSPEILKKIKEKNTISFLWKK